MSAARRPSTKFVFVNFVSLPAGCLLDQGVEEFSIPTPRVWRRPEQSGIFVCYAFSVPVPKLVTRKNLRLKDLATEVEGITSGNRQEFSIGAQPS